MRRLLLLAALVLAGAGCAPGWTHYVTNDGRDAWSFDRPTTDGRPAHGATLVAVLFDEGHPTLVDCTLVDC